jgi:hypothetical protein
MMVECFNAITSGSANGGTAKTTCIADQPVLVAYHGEDAEELVEMSGIA